MNWLRKYFCKSPLKGWGKQSTKEGFNGDIIANEDSIVMVSHTNPNHTESTSDTWKENRVEIHKEIKSAKFNWRLDFKLHKLPRSKEWVILSQIWNFKNANVLCVAVTNLGEGKVKLNLNKKQDGETTGLWSGEFDQYDTHSIDLEVSANAISGTINKLSVGGHRLEVFTNTPTSVKHGMYWSGKIPFNQSNRIVVEYKLY